MHKLLGFLLAAMLLFSFASAEALPESAVMQFSQQAGMLQLYTYLIPETGEEVVLSYENDGELLYVQTQKPAEINEAAANVDRARAEELVQQAYPGSYVLFAKDHEFGKELGVVGEDFCGSIIVTADGIHSRNLEACVPFKDGLLTMEGALKVLALHRPEAEFYALEMEEDDGTWEYEGEARINGEEYEFELNARTGKLLEWERDS